MIHRVKTKFEKGQVWMVNEDSNITTAKLMIDNNHIIAYSRPYLVISVSEYNKIPIIQAIPITSKVRDDLCDRGIQLKFVNMNNEDNALIVTQIHPINEEQFSEFLYVMPQSLMDEVDKYIMRRLGLVSKDKPIPEEEHFINDIIDDISLSKIINSTTNMKKLITGNKKELRKNWSRDDKIKYLNQCRTDSIENIAKKYGISLTTAKTYKNKFKRELY